MPGDRNEIWYHLPQECSWPNTGTSVDESMLARKQKPLPSSSRDRVEDTKKAQAWGRLTLETSNRTGNGKPDKRRRHSTSLVKDRGIPVDGLGVSACWELPLVESASCRFTEKSNVRKFCTGWTPVRRVQALSPIGPVLALDYVTIRYCMVLYS